VGLSQDVIALPPRGFDLKGGAKQSFIHRQNQTHREMETESHGSDYILLAPLPRFFLRFVKTADLKDSRTVGGDVKATKGNVLILFSGIGKERR
jgi:hypothetical protein